MATPDIDPHQTMMATLDEYKEDLGDEKYLRLCNELKAVKESRTDLWRIAYIHQVHFAFKNEDYKAVPRTITTNHHCICRVVPEADPPHRSYNGIHQLSVVKDSWVQEIQHDIRTYGFSTRPALELYDGSEERSILIVKCTKM